VAKKSLMSKIGVWAYVAGIVIAIIVGIIGGLGAITTSILAVLGVIVALLNISDEEVQLFLVASIAFVVAATAMGAVFTSLASTVGSVMTVLAQITSAIVVFTAPGALVVAFKALYNVAKDD
jgi:hypothetical protein